MKRLLPFFLLIPLVCLAQSFTRTAAFKGAAGLRPATGGSSFVDPSSYSPYAWYAGDSYVTNYSDALAVDNERIKVWGDKSGNARHLYGPAASSSSLTYDTGVQNGLPVCNSGANVYMTNTFGVTNSAPITAYCVVRIYAMGTWTYWFESGVVANNLIFGRRNTDIFSHNNWNIGYSTNNQAFIHCYIANGANSALYRNNTLLTNGNNTASSMSGLSIGNVTPFTSGGQQMCEIIVYTNAHDYTQVSNVTYYLNNKWAAY